APRGSRLAFLAARGTMGMGSATQLWSDVFKPFISLESSLTTASAVPSVQKLALPPPEVCLWVDFSTDKALFRAFHLQRPIWWGERLPKGRQAAYKAWEDGGRRYFQDLASGTTCWQLPGISARSEDVPKFLEEQMCVELAAAGEWYDGRPCVVELICQKNCALVSMPDLSHELVVSLDTLKPLSLGKLVTLGDARVGHVVRTLRDTHADLVLYEVELGCTSFAVDVQRLSPKEVRSSSLLGLVPGHLAEGKEQEAHFVRPDGKQETFHVHFPVK
ncbi:unnamed protein product, partial [Effrenium voratum]